jgi:hypothetical protein
VYNIRAGFVGETLWAYSVFDRRLTLISPDRTLLRATSFSLANTGALQGFSLRGMRPDGRALAVVVVRSEEASGAAGRDVTIAETAVVVVGMDGRVERRIGPTHVDTLDVPTGRGGRGASGQRAGAVAVPSSNVGTRVTRGISPDGNTVALVTSRRTERSSSGSVLWLSGAGDTVRSRSYGAMPAPADYVYVGFDRSLWVRGPIHAGVPTQFLVLDGEGAIRGWANLPPRALVVAVSANEVWATEFDPDGFIDVVRYRVE